MLTSFIDLNLLSEFLNFSDIRAIEFRTMYELLGFEKTCSFLSSKISLRLKYSLDLRIKSLKFSSSRDDTLLVLQQKINTFS